MSWIQLGPLPRVVVVYIQSPRVLKHVLDSCDVGEYRNVVRSRRRAPVVYLLHLRPSRVQFGGLGSRQTRFSLEKDSDFRRREREDMSDKSNLTGIDAVRECRTSP